jgi:hypothetical protein
MTIFGMACSFLLNFRDARVCENSDGEVHINADRMLVCPNRTFPLAFGRSLLYFVREVAPELSGDEEAMENSREENSEVFEINIFWVAQKWKSKKNNFLKSQIILDFYFRWR